MLANLEYIEVIKDVDGYARVVLVDLLRIAPDSANIFDQYLDQTDRQKLKKITIEEKRHAFRTCRFVAKQLIGEFCGIDPLTLTFQFTDRGKPYINIPEFQKSEVQFNISHSGNYALVGVSYFNIGVDIECMKSHRNFKKLAKAILSADESKWVLKKTLFIVFIPFGRLKKHV